MQQQISIKREKKSTYTYITTYSLKKINKKSLHDFTIEQENINKLFARLLKALRFLSFNPINNNNNNNNFNDNNDNNKQRNNKLQHFVFFVVVVVVVVAFS